MSDSEKKLISFPGRMHSASVSDDSNAAAFDVESMKARNTFGAKLLEARKNRKLSQPALSAGLQRYHISISVSGISKWEKGITLPNACQLLALCHLLGIGDPVAFFTGAEPESAEFSPELNQKGLNLLRSLKEALIASGQYSPSARRRTTALAEQIEMRTMRISTNRASAGTGNFLSEDSFEEMQFPISQIPENADLGIRIVGDSMIPYYYEGQIVWVELCKELNPGEVGIFVYDGEGYIKQYTEAVPEEDELEDYTCNGIVYPKIYLVSFNKEKYPPRLINPGIPFEIVGRVLN